MVMYIVIVEFGRRMQEISEFKASPGYTGLISKKKKNEIVLNVTTQCRVQGGRSKIVFVYSPVRITDFACTGSKTSSA